MHNILFVKGSHKSNDSLLEKIEKVNENNVIVANSKNEVIQKLKLHNDLDIAIIDVESKNKESIDLIRILKKESPMLYTLSIALYEDFSLTREAFRAGSDDFVLESELTEEFFNNFDVEKNNKNFYGNNSIINMNMLKDRLLRDSIESDEVIDMGAKMNDLKINIGTENFVVLYFWIDDYTSVSERYDGNTINDLSIQVKEVIDKKLKQNNSGYTLVLSPQEYVVFTSFPEINMDNYNETIFDYVTQIQNRMVSAMSISVSVGVSSIGESIDNIRALYREADYNVRLRFIFGKGTIIFSDIASRVLPKSTESIIGKEALFIKSLYETDIEKAQYELEVLLKIIRNSNPERLDRIYASYMEIIYVIVKFLNEKCVDVREILGENVDFYDTIAKFETQEEINEWIKDITDVVVKYLREKKDVKVNRAILRVQEFIRNNFSNDITLKMASDYVGLSESHLSNIFTKKTGDTFTDYLTSVRIEKAKELLETTNLKVYEVCVSVGYANVEHFSRVFKKSTGLSPNSYKNSLLKLP